MLCRYNDRGYAYSYVTSFEGLDRGEVTANINESKASETLSPLRLSPALSRGHPAVE